MKLNDLIIHTNNQLSLLKGLIKSYEVEMESYPKTEQCANIIFIKIEHCYNTLLRLNDLLATSKLG